MDIINELKKDPKFKQAAEKLLYLMGPGLAVMPGPIGAGPDFFNLDKENLPEEIDAANIRLLKSDGSIALKCQLKEGHRPSEALIYVCPSEVGDEMVKWSGDRPEDEYTYLFREELAEGQETLVVELGRLIEESDKPLKDLFDLDRSKIIVRYRQSK